MFGSIIPIHVIDFEGAPSYGVVEYGVASLVGGEIVETQTRLCAALAPIDPKDIAIHGITYEESLRHQSFGEDFAFFADLRRRGVLAAHNARYEAGLVKMYWPTPGMVPAFAREGQMAGWGPWVDSLVLSRRLAPGLTRYKLAVVVEELGLQNELDAIALAKCPEDRRRYHCALYDAIASALILKRLLLSPDSPTPDERIFAGSEKI
jgi:DNA polymerase-3 subunit epsilon